MSLPINQISKHFKHKKMKTLIQTLTEETQSLKVRFLEQTEIWAKAQVLRNIARRERYHNLRMEGFNYPSMAYDNERNYEYVTRNEYYTEQKFYHNSPAWTFEPQEFVNRANKKAVAHYENSIIKLANRIEKKGIDVNNLTLTSGWVDVNIEMTLTDGNKTVRAWTIVASGMIQRPHYRYLVK